MEVSVAAHEKEAGKEGIKLADDLEKKVSDTIGAFAGTDERKGNAVAVVLGARLIDRAPE